MATNGIDATMTAAVLTAMNGGTALAITTPLRCLFLTAVRTADNAPGSDTEFATSQGYVQQVGSLFSGQALTFAAASSGAPSTQNSNVAASVTNMPAGTWAGNKVIDSKNTSRNVTDAVLNSTTTITSATASFVAGDVGALLTGNANIPTNTVIASVTNSTTAVMSQAATATVSTQSVNILKLNSPQTTWWATLGSSKTVNSGDTVTVPSGSFQTSLS